MNKNDCIFCKIIAGDIPATKIYEDSVVLVFLDIGPLSLGHCLVIPKIHYRDVTDCPANVLTEMMKVTKRIAVAIAEALNYSGYNILCNNGRVAGQLVDHLHFHVIGRNPEDGLFSSWPSRSYSDNECREISAKIIEKL